MARLPNDPRVHDAVNDRLHATPSIFDYEVAAVGLGIKADKVPRAGSLSELLVWVFSMHSLRGSGEHFRELVERVAPKVGRRKAEKPASRAVPGVLAGAGMAATAEANAWFEGLDEADTDDELM